MINQILDEATLQLLLQKGYPQDLAKKAADKRRYRRHPPTQPETTAHCSENQQRIISESWQYLIQ